MSGHLTVFFKSFSHKFSAEIYYTLPRRAGWKLGVGITCTTLTNYDPFGFNFDFCYHASAAVSGRLRGGFRRGRRRRGAPASRRASGKGPEKALLLARLSGGWNHG